MENQEGGRTPEIVDSSHALAIELRAQREIAISTPRDEDAVFSQVMRDLERAPEFAEEAFYSLPRGDKTITDLSVKASRAIQRRWRNCATASRIVGQDEDAYMVEGIAVDFETNCIFRSTVRVTKTYVPRGKTTPQPRTEDNLNNAVQAGMSKAERNAFLKMLPEYMKSRYFNAARELAKKKGQEEGKATGKTPQERMVTLLEAFKTFGVERVRVEAYVNANFKKEDDPEEILVTMRGLWNSIKDGQVKASEVFSTDPAGGARETSVKLADVMGAKTQSSASGGKAAATQPAAPATPAAAPQPAQVSGEQEDIL